jgi:eukaryotic-like serine/threonine-protein kinase
MNPDRWQRIEELYHAALAREREGRAAFLANACQGDEELRREVESLLKRAVSASGLLDHPAVDVAHIVSRVGTMLAGTRQVGNYRLLSLLGAGGMGQVYLAEDTRLLRKVAIKFLPVEAVNDERAKRRLIHEARAAATLDHPNICAIYEVGEADGHHFIAMQYVEGETLSARLSTGRMDLRAALAVATQIARALAEAHKRGIVHRDIKPQNIMLSQHDHVKVLDFGLAKVISPFGETTSPSVCRRSREQLPARCPTCHLSSSEATLSIIEPISLVSASCCTRSCRESIPLPPTTPRTRSRRS